jgi:hypothetical protein
LILENLSLKEVHLNEEKWLPCDVNVETFGWTILTIISPFSTISGRSPEGNMIFSYWHQPAFRAFKNATIMAAIETWREQGVILAYNINVSSTTMRNRQS